MKADMSTLLVTGRLSPPLPGRRFGGDDLGTGLYLAGVDLGIPWPSTFSDRESTMTEPTDDLSRFATSPPPWRSPSKQFNTATGRGLDRDMLTALENARALAAKAAAMRDAARRCRRSAAINRSRTADKS